MKNFVFLELVKNFRKGEMEAFTEIYKSFRDLIMYYGKKMDDEDSVQELTVFLLELMYSIDTKRFLPDCSNGMHRYVAVALRNKYIALSKENQTYIVLINELDENDFLSANTLDGIYFVKECLKKLPLRQRTVILYRYVYGYPDSEIALLLKISRQSVSRLRNKALNALREFYV